jgi:hypothetical protein
MRKLRALLISLSLLSFASLTVTASAQSTDPVAATELFKQGREAMSKGDHATACRKFGDSARLDVKVGTLLNLAECEEKLGKIAAARRDVQRALDIARAQNDDRAELAKTRLAALDKRVPKLTVTLTSKVEARVRRDDVELGEGSLGSPLPVEPGEHVVVVSAPKHQDRTFNVKLAEGEQQTLAVDVGPEDAAAPSGAPAKSENASNGLRTTGWIVGGAGVASLGAGAIFALMAMSANSKSNETCVDNLCDRAGKESRDDALAAGNVATAFFILGGVAVAAGGVMILTSPSERKTARLAPVVSPHIAGLSLGGAF